MSNYCQITQKKPMSGHHVSHARNKVNRWFKPNLHVKRFWIPSQNRFIKLRVSAHGMRIIDRMGIEAAIRKYGLA